jgi:hypothetical protein
MLHTHQLGLDILAGVLACSIFAVPPLMAQTTAPSPAATPPAEDVTALAKQQQDRTSSLISVPLMHNLNTGGGLEDRTYYLLNAMPVLPFKLNDSWNVVSRTVLPLVSTPGPGDSRCSGIGDTQRQFDLTPSQARPLTRGVGPVFSLPTGVDVLGCRGRHEDEPVPGPAVRQLQHRQGVCHHLGAPDHRQLGSGERPAADRPGGTRPHANHQALGEAPGRGRALLLQRRPPGHGPVEPGEVHGSPALPAEAVNRRWA